MNSLIADNWDRHKHAYKKEEYGQWSLTLPPVDGKPAIPHRSIVKVVQILNLNAINIL